MTAIQDSHLYQEIHQQPEVVGRVIADRVDIIARLCEAIREGGIRHFVIAARGTSDNAGRYAKYLFGAKNGVVVSLATPSLYTIYRQPPDLRDSLVIGISQSGQSPDINQVLGEAQRQGALTAAITNDPHSTLAQTADFTLDIAAEREVSIAATKSYTAQLAAIALLSAQLRGDDAMLAALDTLPAAMEAALGTSPVARRIAQEFQEMRHIAVIGRGYNYATAFELALKLKELTYTLAEPYSSADFMHGPLALVEADFPILMVAPSGKLVPEMVAFQDATRKLGARTIGISDDASFLAGSDFSLQLPSPVPEWLSVLTAVIPGQLLSMHLAHLRNIELDKPRTISKITKTT